jgi:antitoxin ParD1/3/4
MYPFPELEQFRAAKAELGRYGSAREVVREALSLLEERDQSKAAQLSELNQELERRLVARDRGQRADPAETRRRLKNKSDARRKVRV